MGEYNKVTAVAVLLIIFAVAGCFLWFGIGWFILWCVDHLGYSDQIDETVFKTVWLALFAPMILRLGTDSVQTTLKKE